MRSLYELFIETSRGLDRGFDVREVPLPLNSKGVGREVMSFCLTRFVRATSLIFLLAFSHIESVGATPTTLPEMSVPVVERIPQGVRAGETLRRRLSSEHVNLVRVLGEAITDVVYDTEALEVSPDAAHGAVFVRVKASWLRYGKHETAAYFNTPRKSYGVMFEVGEAPSQTIEIKGEAPVDREAGFPRAPEVNAMARFTNDAYSAELKALLLKALSEPDRSVTPSVGAITESKDASFVRLPFRPRERAWRGFRVKETRAYVTRDRLVEVLEVRFMREGASRLPLGELAQKSPGALALAATHLAYTAGEAGRIVVMSDRRLREGEKGVLLTVDTLAKSEARTKRRALRQREE